MSPIYCTIEQLSKLFRVDYSSLLGMLHRDAANHPEVKKFNRYVLSEVAALHKTTAEPLEIDLDTPFLTLYEAQAILSEQLGPMVYSTVLRKAAKGEIPALKFGDTYRVPEPILLRYLQEKKISYRARNPQAKRD
ncbi:MerR family transcriptional regulator [Effusibacillus pohliae]|uniref:helix-turn-helix domain-containing protein n=1 Tax=Effusibacillus pohliae TaxID=232270 RepID=UPI00039E2D13|nr:helix-turn-helix domain-containing protein [Effusibacillus pohliae]